MTIIGRLAEYMGIDLTEKADLSGFKDADQAADYARDYIAALAAKGIVKGDGEKLNPKSVLSRAEAAALLVRVLELQG